MRKIRIFQDQPMQADLEFSLNSEGSHHLMTVLRCKKEMIIYLFNGDGLEYQARIVELTKKGVMVEIIAAERKNNESPLQLHLGQAISRGDRMDFTLQKAVELGVTEFTPLISEHAGISPTDKKRLQQKIDHWQKVIVSACEQSGRCVIPILHPVETLLVWLAQPHPNGLVLSPTGDVSLTGLEKNNHFTLLVGNEGGFSDTELKHAQLNHFKAVRMGPRILRTETAAIAAVSFLQGTWGDFL